MFGASTAAGKKGAATKILVTGAKGSVGGRAVRYLAGRGIRAEHDRAEGNKEVFAFQPPPGRRSADGDAAASVGGMIEAPNRGEREALPGAYAEAAAIRTAPVVTAPTTQGDETMPDTQARAVRLDEYGDLDVLYVADVPMPEPAGGEVVVAVRAAGINPFEALVRSGAMRDLFPATFPVGQGTDVAGVVTAVGPGVDGFAVGDEVMGWSGGSTHATHAAVPAGQLIPKPPGLGWEVAGSLQMAGSTAYAAVRAVDPKPGETVAVSAAAGGVGTVAVQLLARRGVRVLGIASAANAGWLTARGAVPVAYGDGLRERLSAAAGPGGVDAFVDLFGPEYLDLAVDLGIPPDRIETVVAFGRAKELGAKSEARRDASTPEVLAELTDLVAAGEVEVPVAAAYPLERVADAFAELERRHTRGKIALIP